MADIRINSLPSTATSFNTDDYIAIDGASGGTRKMLAANPPFSDVTLGTSGPSVKSTLSARAPRQGLVFDGTAGCSGLTGIAGPATGDFTIAAVIRTTSASIAQVVVGSASSGVGVFLENTGQVNISVVDVSNGLTGYYVTANKSVLLTYVRASGVGYLYADGVQVYTGSDTRNFSGTYSRVGVYYNGTSNPFRGTINGPYIYNRALSASEVVALYEAGAPSGADYNSASNTNLTSAGYVNQDFTTFTASGTTGFTATNTTGGARYAKSNADFSIVQSGKVRLFYDLSGTGTVYARLGKIGVANYSDLVTLTAGTGKYVDLTATATASNCTVLFMSQGSTDNFTIANSTAVRIGLLLAPDAAQAGGGLVWYDTSGNAANITLPASGVSWNVPSSQKTASGWTFGGAVTSNSESATASGSVIKAASTSAGTAQYWQELQTSSGTVLGRVLRGNGASGFQANGLNIDSFGGFQVRANQLGGSGETIVLTGGNVLIGTTTDSANGKLQLATHTTSAGGIGFGTDTSLWRVRSGTLGINDAGGSPNPRLEFYEQLSYKASIQTYLGDMQVGTETAGKSLALRSGAAVTALTLDSSQNATFNGGTVTLGDYAGDQDVIIAAQSTGVGYLRWRPTASGTNAYGFSIGYDNPNNKLSFLRHEFSTAGVEWLSVARATGNATFAGAIAIGNTVNTVSPTSPNRTITMVIGGTTYYIHAKTTND